MRKSVRVLLVLALVITGLGIGVLTAGAQGGRTWVSGIQIQNQSTTDVANITVIFYWDEAHGGAEAHRFSDTIDAGKAKTYYVPTASQTSGLPVGFIGSAVVSSDQPVAANVNTQVPASEGTTPGLPIRIGTSSGVLEPSTDLYFPQIMKGYYGWNSYLAIQNTASSSASVTVQYYNTAGTLVATDVETVSPFSTYIFRQSDNASLPTSDFVGSAKATGTQELAGICNFYASEATYTEAQFHSYNAFSGGQTTLNVPRVVKDYYSYQSGLSVQNVGTSATTVTVTYYFGGTAYTQTSPSIDPNAAWGVYLGTEAQLPASMAGVSGSGSAKIESAGQPVVAIVNEDNRTLGYGVTYNAFLDGEETTTVLFPQVAAKYYGFCSGIQIQNVGTATANLTITYSMAGRSDVTKSGTAAPGESYSKFAPDEGVGDDFNGSVVVTSNQPIVGISNMSYRVDVDPRLGAKYGDSFTTYNGINK